MDIPWIVDKCDDVEVTLILDPFLTLVYSWLEDDNHLSRRAVARGINWREKDPNIYWHIWTHIINYITFLVRGIYA